MTVGEWADKWLASKVNLAESTRDRYADVIDAWVRPRWGAVKLSAVTHEALQAWLAEIDRAPATVRKVHRVVSQMFDYAVKAGRLHKNPATGVSLPRVRAAEKRYLSHGQVDAMAAEVGPEWATLVYFLAYTGVRWGEAAALRVRNVDIERRRASIVESVTPVRGVMVWGATKTHERREVPLPRFLAVLLEGHVMGKAPDALVFTGPQGAVLRGSTFRARALSHAAEELGLCVPKLDAEGKQVTRRRRGVDVPVFTGHFHPHEFRHTAASLAIASGADVKVVQQMLGHKSATMTLDLYGHLFPDRLDVVADAMEAARLAGSTAADQAAIGSGSCDQMVTMPVAQAPGDSEAA
ncbi:MAG: tyrosine-type recombinase/integrase [Propionibacteriaceae bacterium]|nr:tyrosine-type recombinase/integrase [Propionibacteriaceae bacterium]